MKADYQGYNRTGRQELGDVEPPFHKMTEEVPLRPTKEALEFALKGWWGRPYSGPLHRAAPYSSHRPTSPPGNECSGAPGSKGCN